MKVIHRIGSGSIHHAGMTTCGIIATEKVGKDEYAVFDRKPIKAVWRTWDGVTCKSCLRNPHAPGQRFHAAEAANATR